MVIFESESSLPYCSMSACQPKQKGIQEGKTKAYVSDENGLIVPSTQILTMELRIFCAADYTV